MTHRKNFINIYEVAQKEHYSMIVNSTICDFILTYAGYAVDDQRRLRVLQIMANTLNILIR